MKVLFVSANRIGDAVLSTGLVEHIARTHPGVRLTIACGPAAANLFEAAPHVERIITMIKARWSGHWLHLWCETVGHFWDLVIDLRASALAWLVPARSRRVLRRSSEPVHRLVHLAGVLGLSEPALPHVWIARHHREAAAALIPGHGPVLAVGPTANWGGKQWRAERFAETVTRLTSSAGILPDARVAVLGAGPERPSAAALLKAIPENRRIDLLGQTDLLTASACLRRCALYLGNDSGLMHLAAASAVPTLGLFGPSRDSHYAPWGPLTAVVRTELAYEQLVGGPGYDHRRQETLMDSLSVDKVEQAALALWRRTRV